MVELKDRINYFDRIEDHPTPGISFYDIHGLLRHPDVWAEAMFNLKSQGEEYEPTALVAADARGFLLAGPLAILFNCKVVLARKAGKLPQPVRTLSYQTEYSTDTIQIRDGALKEGDRFLIVDDVLATGGTAAAIAQLGSLVGAEPLAMLTLLELPFLKGAEKLQLPVHTWCQP